MSKELEIATRVARGDHALELGVLELGPTTPYTCPDCAGVLVRMNEGGVPTFRCHTGHAFSFDTLMAASTEHTEEALWNALRSVEETIILLRHAARHARDRGDAASADAAARRADEAQQRADLLREVVAQHRALAHESLGGGFAAAADGAR